MPRYKLTLEYDGTKYVGWQRQANGESVQHLLESAITQLCGAHCAVTAAGRTDAGVHASGQVAHFDSPRLYSADTVRDALNFHLNKEHVLMREDTPAKWICFTNNLFILI